MAVAEETAGGGEVKPGRKSYPLYDSPLLKARARVQEGRMNEGRVKVDAYGPLANLPIIKSALQMFDGQIASFADM